MTVYYDNPAGRLHRVLKGLKEVNPSSASVRDAWAKVLDVPLPSQSMGLLSRRIVEVLQMPPQIDFGMQQISDDYFDRDFAMRWRQPVQTTFANLLFSTAQIAQGLHYDDASLGSLETCSFWLHRFHREPIPSKNDLGHIRNLLAEITNIVASDETMHPALAGFLLQHVRAMEGAIDDFDFTGATAIQAALDHAFGASIREGYLPTEETEDEPADDNGSQRAIKKFWNMLSRTALVLSIGGSLLAIGQAAYTDMKTTPRISPSIENIINVDESPLSGKSVIDINVNNNPSEINPKRAG